jgi:hypothetical protein
VRYGIGFSQYLGRWRVDGIRESKVEGSSTLGGCAALIHPTIGYFIPHVKCGILHIVVYSFMLCVISVNKWWGRFAKLAKNAEVARKRATSHVADFRLCPFRVIAAEVRRKPVWVNNEPAWWDGECFFYLTHNKLENPCPIIIL